MSADELEALRQKIAQFKPGFAERPADRHPDAQDGCERCGGLGWERSETYGTWLMCGCTIRRVPPPEPDYALLGIRKDELALTWDDVKAGLSDGPKGAAAVRKAYERGWGLVFLWGTYGQAKTLIGKILIATALRDGKTAMYANVASVLDDIRRSFEDREHKTTELLRRMDWWTGRDVLYLDELDKANSTDWARERLFQLIDQRYERAVRAEALTVIASNRSDGELDGYLRSRLHDRRVGLVVHLTGQDARQVVPDGWRH